MNIFTIAGQKPMSQDLKGFVKKRYLIFTVTYFIHKIILCDVILIDGN